jgi:hypothetical protein
MDSIRFANFDLRIKQNGNKNFVPTQTKLAQGCSQDCCDKYPEKMIVVLKKVRVI